MELGKKLFGKKDDKKREKDEKDKLANADNLDENLDIEANQEPTKKIVKNAEVGEEGYQVFKLPWSINLSYSYNIREDRSKPINPSSMRYPFTYTHNLNLNGSIKISNKWSMTFNSGYDFQAKEITQTSCSISRDLHCFTLTASLSPFGRWQYYNVTIRAKANILQDLKYETRSQTRAAIDWY